MTRHTKLSCSYTLRLQRNLDAFLGPQYQSLYLAQKGASFEGWQTKFSTVGSSWHYLFRDITITNKASGAIGDSSVLNITSSLSAESKAGSSEDEVMEISREPSSFDRVWRCPQKIGEVIVQLHFLLVAKYTRRIVRGIYPTSVTCRGAGCYLHQFGEVQAH